MSEEKSKGLLPEDHDEIRVVPDEVRAVWERKRIYSDEEKARLRKRALEALENYRARRRR